MPQKFRVIHYLQMPLVLRHQYPHTSTLSQAMKHSVQTPVLQHKTKTPYSDTSTLTQAIQHSVQIPVLQHNTQTPVLQHNTKAPVLTHQYFNTGNPVQRSDTSTPTQY